MARCSPRSNRVLSSEVDRLFRHLQEAPLAGKGLKRVPKEPAASAKHIQSVEYHGRDVRAKRQLSTRTPSPEASFLMEFEQQVSCQKQAINIIRRESLKENRQQSAQTPQIMDIVDWVKMRPPNKRLLGDTMFEKDQQALQKMISRNNQAIGSLVRNRGHLIDIALGRQLKLY